ncbi:hypothetical protein GW756_03425 [bacterium]|nr:hypothetical protein [bacterium]NCQ55431.1 hypothetical protein [Candidatus Parcubacteria bacterium]NCS67793.1 hypothetical protein [Candidatus Peregrinibacteria bacterium]NCS96393.1 hypothetical protein [bacterium]
MTIKGLELRTTIETVLACDDAQVYPIETDFEGDWYWLSSRGSVIKGCEKIFISPLADRVSSFKKKIEIIVSAQDLALAYPEIDFSCSATGVSELWKRGL